MQTCHCLSLAQWSPISSQAKVLLIVIAFLKRHTFSKILHSVGLGDFYFALSLEPIGLCANSSS